MYMLLQPLYIQDWHITWHVTSSVSDTLWVRLLVEKKNSTSLYLQGRGARKNG
jgi:hypothetical protein